MAQIRLIPVVTGYLGGTGWYGKGLAADDGSPFHAATIYRRAERGLGSGGHP